METVMDTHDDVRRCLWSLRNARFENLPERVILPADEG
jgi:hypothetical protein